MEFHMKMQHFQSDKTLKVSKDDTQLTAAAALSQYGVCLADFCDTFECKELTERSLKSQVFMYRNDSF